MSWTAVLLLRMDSINASTADTSLWPSATARSSSVRPLSGSRLHVLQTGSRDAMCCSFLPVTERKDSSKTLPIGVSFFQSEQQR